MSKTVTIPDFRIFKTYELANKRAKQLTKRTKRKWIILCVRQHAYLVVYDKFNPIKLGFGYPTTAIRTPKRPYNGPPTN